MAAIDKGEALTIIQEKLTIMLASATPLVKGDEIVGYQIKTGALHHILGIMEGADYPVTVPIHHTKIEVQ